MGNVKFLVHTPMEVLYALYAVGTGKGFFDMLDDIGITPSDEIKDSIVFLKERLSSYIKGELDYFFDLGGIGFIFYKTIVKNSGVTDINKLVEELLKTSNLDFTFDIIESVCKNALAKMKDEEIQSLRLDRVKMMELAVAGEYQDELRKKRVLEAVNNPDEVKERLGLTLKQFYNKAFKEIEPRIIETSRQAMTRYMEIFARDSNGFLRKYINLDSQGYSESINIHVSFFKHAGWHYYSKPDKNKKHWFILGACSDLILDNKVSSERLSSFFKALSDKKRVEIVRLLTEKPCYGQELAEKLDITPATVSYHMTFLSDEGLISVVRLNNRFYYSLNSSKLKEMLGLAEGLLVIDEK